MSREETTDAPVTMMLMVISGENEAQILSSASPVESLQRAEWREFVGLAGHRPQEWATNPHVRLELPRYCQPGAFFTELVVRWGPAQASHWCEEGFTAVGLTNAILQTQTDTTAPEIKLQKVP